MISGSLKGFLLVFSYGLVIVSYSYVPKVQYCDLTHCCPKGSSVHFAVCGCDLVSNQKRFAAGNISCEPLFFKMLYYKNDVEY